MPNDTCPECAGRHVVNIGMVGAVDYLSCQSCGAVYPVPTRWRTDAGVDRHVVMFSGGIGSWAAAKRVAERHGTDKLALLFTDTLIEDEDLYRFLGDAAVNVGGEFVYLADGRTPWQVFFDVRFLGNSRIAPCTHVLKQQVAQAWLDANCDPARTRVYIGIDWSEEHRYEQTRDIQAAKGWAYEAPLCEPPYLTKTDVIAWAVREGLTPPRLYEMGFAHNNCGGFCVKAGQGHFLTLLKALPDRFEAHEQMEQEFRDFIGKDVSILSDRRGGAKKPLTLRELRKRIARDIRSVDKFDIGGCGCFLQPEEAA